MWINFISVLQVLFVAGAIPEYAPVGQYYCKNGDYYFATSYYTKIKKTAKAKCKKHGCDVIVEWTNKWNWIGYDFGKSIKANDKSGCPQNKDMTAKIIWQKPRADAEYTNSNNTINEFWSTWSSWSSCSSTCGAGQKRRERACSISSCSGSEYEVIDCNNDACAFWYEWSDWSHCSKSCDGGIRTRSRNCSAYRKCPGKSKETSKCNTHQCVKISAWSDWSGCSKTCGKGIDYRNRKCTGSGCLKYIEKDIRNCHLEGCVSQWSGWSECSASCGKGTQTRSRSCQSYNCHEKLYETKNCFQKGCVSHWSGWSGCSVSCGEGFQTRSRACQGTNCKENLHENQHCWLQPCLNIPNYGPIDGTQNCLLRADRSYDNFSMLKNYESRNQAEKACRLKWDVCDIIVEINRSRGLRKIFEIGSTRAKPCQNKNARDVESTKVVWQGHYVGYGPVGQNTCLGYHDRFYDSFSQSKTYESLSLAKIYCQKVHHPRCDIIVEIRQPDDRNRGGLKVVYEIGSTKSTPFCPGRHFLEYDEPFRRFDLIVHKIPIPSNWSNWSSCSKTCGQGKRTRVRTCSIQGKCHGQLEETLTCYNEPCATWSGWSSWSRCSVSCGSGFQERKRSCSVQEKCVGDSDQSKNCWKQQCPTRSYWGSWGSWSQCSVSCGTGTKNRTRSCPIQGACTGVQPLESNNCWLQKCPDIADQSYHKTVTRSSGFSKLNGILTYGPVQPGHYCTSSMGGALSYGYLSKKNAESYCKTFKCDIITELSNGKFEIGLTTRMNKCNIETNNIKQQWFKGQN